LVSLVAGADDDDRLNRKAGADIDMAKENRLA
jgi:hypothetical protein